MSGERFVVYVQPAKMNLENLDESPETRIRTQCEKFLNAWQPDSVFSKGTGYDPVRQVKKNVARNGLLARTGQVIAMTSY